MSTVFHAVAAAILASFAMLGNLFGPPRTLTIAPQSSAVVYSVVAPASLNIATTANSTTGNETAAATSTSSAPLLAAATGEMAFGATLPVATPGLLPNIALSKRKQPSATSSATTPANTAQTTASSPPPAPVQKNPVILSAQDILSQTSIAFKATRDGRYEIVLTTNTGAAPLIWNLTDATIGGGNGLSFSVSYACNPQPGLQLPGEIDQNPSFSVRTAYDCTIALAPLGGTDRRTQSRDFSFTTPAGKLVVTAPASMDSLLANDTNSGGFVFNNTDGGPVTVTGLTFDVSYQYLTTIYGPLVLRILDPTTESPLNDYHLETIPADSEAQYGYHSSNVAIPVSFTLKGTSQKLLPVQMLGVRKMLVSSTTPRVALTLTGVTTDPANVETILEGAAISWSCDVMIGGYDPNATSGPIATGRVCTN